MKGAGDVVTVFFSFLSNLKWCTELMTPGVGASNNQNMSSVSSKVLADTWYRISTPPWLNSDSSYSFQNKWVTKSPLSYVKWLCGKSNQKVKITTEFMLFIDTTRWALLLKQYLTESNFNLFLWNVRAREWYGLALTVSQFLPSTLVTIVT